MSDARSLLDIVDLSVDELRLVLELAGRPIPRSARRSPGRAWH